MSRMKSEGTGAVPAAAADSGALISIVIEYGAESNRRAWRCPADSPSCKAIGLNAETQRNAEKRRGRELSASLCESLRLCVKSSQAASHPAAPQYFKLVKR